MCRYLLLVRINYLYLQLENKVLINLFVFLFFLLHKGQKKCADIFLLNWINYLYLQLENRVINQSICIFVFLPS
jgi:hypothetical protein